MKLQEWAKEKGNVIVPIIGGFRMGKTLIANHIKQNYDIPVLSVREHYFSCLLPRYLTAKENGREISPNENLRGLTIKAADWIYSKSADAYIKLFEQDTEVEPTEKIIVIESLRILGDVKYLMENYTTKPLIIWAEDEIRIKRMVSSNEQENLEKLDCEKAIIRIKKEREHFGLDKTIEYVRGFNAGFIDTTNYSNKEIPKEKIESFMDPIIFR